MLVLYRIVRMAKSLFQCLTLAYTIGENLKESRILFCMVQYHISSWVFSNRLVCSSLNSSLQSLSRAV